MKITYIDHSGYLVENEFSYFLFDYYKGTIPNIDPRKNLVVFVSHKHPDHYNPDIFELIEKYPKSLFILPKGTPTRPFIEKYSKKCLDLEANIMIVRKNEKYEVKLSDDSELIIQTLRSTDIGVAYIIEYMGTRLYHAGDLNLWLWDEEPLQFNNNMRTAFFKEMEKLKNMNFDVAFLPLDPRQENHAFDGMEAFLEYTHTKVVFPMHMWDDYEIIDKFTYKHPELTDTVIKIDHSGQEWRVNDEV